MQSFYKQYEYEYKNQISLLEALSDKILRANPYISKNAKFISLKENFQELFKEKTGKLIFQSREEQIRNMRSRM